MAKGKLQEVIFGNMRNDLYEFRCPYCNKLLFRYKDITIIEIKCDRCKKILECREHGSKK